MISRVVLITQLHLPSFNWGYDGDNHPSILSLRVAPVCEEDYDLFSWWGFLTSGNKYERSVFYVVVLVAQSSLTLCDPMGCTPLGSSIHGILQARMLQWVLSPFSRGSPRPRDGTQASGIAGKFFTVWATWKPVFYLMYLSQLSICELGKWTAVGNLDKV